MEDINLLEIIVYLDNLIVFERTLEEHEEHPLKVLDHLREQGLNLSLDKCQFCQTSVKYVGHIVSENSIAMDLSKVQALTTWPKHQALKELQSFLGFNRYYR